jgi:pSer/pThr/pTyr-binding forkhead associated (FHA) protein
MEAKLVVVAGDAPARQYDLTLPTIIGRSRSVGLVVPNPLVSRQHCELFESGGQLMVRDLGSLNGTFVGDMRVAQEAALDPGHLLTVGSVTFRAVYGAALAEDENAEPGAEFGLADTSGDFETHEPPDSGKPTNKPPAKNSPANKPPADAPKKRPKPAADSGPGPGDSTKPSPPAKDDDMDDFLKDLGLQ